MLDFTGATLGPYKLVERVGRGGMATVYKAYHEATERYVAIKVLPQELAEDPRFVARFEREAKIVASLQHINILSVFDYGQEKGVAYLVMPFVPTGNLKEYMGSGLSLQETNRLFCQVAEAVGYAHKKDVIHRDIKPSNVLLDDSNNALLADFGLTRMARSASSLTGTGVIGTPDYMSPEQGQGLEVDERSDIYSLGIMLYEMVVGEVPFTAETPVAIIFKHISQPVPLPTARRPELSQPVEDVILKALAKKPANRFQSADEMAEALRSAMAGTPSNLDMPPRVERIVADRRPAVAPQDMVSPTEVSDLTPIKLDVDKASPKDEQEETKETQSKSKRSPVLWIALGIVGLLVLGGIVLLASGALGGSETPTAVAQSTGSTSTTTRKPTDQITETITESKLATPSTPSVRARREIVARAGPDSSYPVLATLEADDRLDLIGISEDGAWYQVALADDSVGWVASSAALVETFGNLDAVPLAQLPTHTPTSIPTDTPTRTPTNTPTPNQKATEERATFEAAMLALETQTAVASETVAYQTMVALSATPTPSSTSTPTITPTPLPGFCTTTTTAAANLRLGPGGSGQSVEVAQANTELQVLGQTSSGQWYHVRTEDGRRAWVAAELVNTPNCSDPGFSLPAAIFANHTDTVWAVSWSPDGRYIVSASEDTTARAWDVQTGEEVARLPSFTYGIIAADWHTHPDNDIDYVAVGGWDGTVRIWELIKAPDDAGEETFTAEQVAIMGAEAYFFYDVAWRPPRAGNAMWLAGASADGKIHVWMVTSDIEIEVEEVATFETPSRELHSVAWSPDGTMLAGGGTDGTLRIWDLESGDQLAELAGHTDAVRSLAWSPDGVHLASAALDNTVRLWALELDSEGRVGGGEETNTLSAHQRGGALAVAWSPDSAHLASGGGDAVARVWNRTSGEEVLTLKGHAGDVHAVAWSPDGAYLLTGGADETVRAWRLLEITGSAQAAAIPASVASAAKRSTTTNTPDDIPLPTSSDTFEPSPSPTPTGKPVAKAEVETTDAAQFCTGEVSTGANLRLGPFGAMLEPVEAGTVLDIVGQDDSGDWYRVRRADGSRAWIGADLLAGPACPEDITLPVVIRYGHNDAVWSVAWSPDAAQLASAGQDGQVLIWDADGEDVQRLTGHMYGVTSLAWQQNPTGTSWLASSGWDAAVFVWEMPGGTLLTTIPIPTQFMVHALAWQPTPAEDGLLLAAASADGKIYVWSIAEDDADGVAVEPVATLAGHSGEVRAVDWSPDGAYLISGATDNSIRIWSVETGETVAKLTEHTNVVRAVDWSPDGKAIASASTDGTVRVWSIEITSHGILGLDDTPHTLGTSQNQLRGVLTVAWSPDSAYLACGGLDNKVHVWSARQIDDGTDEVLEGHSKAVRALAWSPTGNRLISGSADRSVQLWIVP